MKTIKAENYIYGTFAHSSKGYHVISCSSEIEDLTSEIRKCYEKLGESNEKILKETCFFTCLIQENIRLIAILSCNGIDDRGRINAMVSQGVILSKEDFELFSCNPYLIFPSLNINNINKLSQTKGIGELPLMQIENSKSKINFLKKSIETLEDNSFEKLYLITQNLWNNEKIRLSHSLHNIELLRIAFEITPIYLRNGLSFSEFSYLQTKMFYNITLSLDMQDKIENQTNFPKYFEPRINEVLDFIVNEDNDEYLEFINRKSLVPEKEKWWKPILNIIKK